MNSLSNNYTVLGKRHAEEATTQAKLPRGESRCNFMLLPRELLVLIVDHVGEWKTARSINNKMLSITDERVVVWMDERNKKLRPNCLFRPLAHNWFYHKFGPKMECLTLTRFCRSDRELKLEDLSIFTNLRVLNLERTSLLKPNIQKGYFNEGSFKRLTSLTCIKANFTLAIDHLGTIVNRTNLRSLVLSQNSLNREALAKVIDSLKQLTSLHLMYEPIGLNGAQLLAVSVTSCLTELKLHHTHIPFEGFAALVSSPILVNITKFAFVDNFHVIPTHSHISFNMPHVTKLDLSENSLGPVLEQIASDPNLGNLRLLNLRNTRMMPAGAVALGRSTVISQLAVLILDKNNISDEAIAFITDRHTSLRELSLDRVRMGIPGLTSLIMANLPQLADLNLESNELGTEGARLLASCTFTNLTTLNLNYNKFQKNGVEHFLANVVLPQLKTLKIGLCQVHPTHMPLFKRFPNLVNISWDKLS